VQAGHALNPRLEESYTATGLKVGPKVTTEEAAAAPAWLCDKYVDIRLFGAVLSVGKTQALGQIRGPLQLTMARSIDPVFPIDHTITRVTQTKQEDIDKGESTEMGGKWTVPYGLYRAEVYYAATRGQQTGVTGRDLELFYRSLQMMFDHDRSATRGILSARGLYVFSHADAFGSAPAHTLTERIRALHGRRSVPISALEHHAYCPRQAALIHLGATSSPTWTPSAVAHAAVNQPGAGTDRRQAQVRRSLPVWSVRLGLHGLCDVVQFDPQGRPTPVEHK
jgi:CRISPR-associated protein Cas7/Csd2 subtype I-C